MSNGRTANPGGWLVNPELNRATFVTTPPQDSAKPAKPPRPAGHSRPPTQAKRGQARVGTWQFDPDMEGGFWSKEMYSLLGRERALGRPSSPEFFELFHPDDRAALLATQNPAPWAGDEFEVHVRTNPARGPMRLIHIISRAVRDKAGRQTYLTGTVEDETDRKLSGEAP